MDGLFGGEVHDNGLKRIALRVGKLVAGRRLRLPHAHRAEWQGDSACLEHLEELLKGVLLLARTGLVGLVRCCDVCKDAADVQVRELPEFCDHICGFFVDSETDAVHAAVDCNMNERFLAHLSCMLVELAHRITHVHGQCDIVLDRCVIAVFRAVTKGQDILLLDERSQFQRFPDGCNRVHIRRARLFFKNLCHVESAHAFRVALQDGADFDVFIDLIGQAANFAVVVDQFRLVDLDPDITIISHSCYLQ